MNFTAHLLAGSLLVALGVVAPAWSAETVRPLFRHELSDVRGRTFTTAEVEFAAGAKALPHRHGHAFVYAYVLSGAVRSQLSGAAARTYQAGESWFEPPGAHHVLAENASARDPRDCSWCSSRRPASR